MLSSRVIPGHEPEVYALMGDLLRKGVELRSWISDRGVHVSGHAHSAEQRRMIELVRPKSFVPVHGTLHHSAPARRARARVRRRRGDDPRGRRRGVLDAARSPQRRARADAGVFTSWAGARCRRRCSAKDRLAIAQAGVAVVVVRLNARGDLVGDVAIRPERSARRGSRPGAPRGVRSVKRARRSPSSPPAPKARSTRPPSPKR